MKIVIKELGVIYPSPNTKRKRRCVLVECPKCHNQRIISKSNLKLNASTDCTDCKEPTHITHGLRSDPLYTVWAGMKNRCTNPKEPAYAKYGGKGIRVSEEWQDFKVFHTWAYANGYKPHKLSIDRINPDGDYEASNCRWATAQVQAENTSGLNANNTSGCIGVSYRKRNKKFVAAIGMFGKQKHIGYFNTAVEAGEAYDQFVITHKLSRKTNKEI